MSFKVLPIYFFPAATVFLDDEEKFLEALNFAIGNKERMHWYSNSADFLEFLNNREVRDHEYLKQNYETDYDNISIDFDIGKIHAMIYDDERYNTVSSTIVDFNLNGQSGLEILKQVNSPINKILLTGFANEQLAIDAFNQKHIDCYLKKQDMGLVEKLLDSISIAEVHYFESFGREFINYLARIRYRDTAMKDKIYIELFNKILSQYRIREFYLLDAAGSYLLIDDAGKDYCLLICSSDQLDASLDVMRDAAVSEDLIRRVASKDLIYYDKKHFFKNSLQFFEPSRLQTSSGQVFYYTLIEAKFSFQKKPKISSSAPSA